MDDGDPRDDARDGPDDRDAPAPSDPPGTSEPPASDRTRAAGQSDRELADAVADLADALESLRSELRDPPRGPLGLPRPPRPREVLRFTERYTIPAAIATLEASIRSLELLAAAIRFADGRAFDDAGAPDATAGAPRDRLAAASRGTLERLDDVLADLATAAEGGTPADPELRRMLEEARGLRDEVQRRLDEATGLADGDSSGDDVEPYEVEIRSGESSDTTGVDVDEELETLKREVDVGERDRDGDDAGDAVDETTDDDGGRDANSGDGEGDSAPDDDDR